MQRLAFFYFKSKYSVFSITIYINVLHHILIQGDMDRVLVMLRDNGSGYTYRDVGVDTVLLQEAMALGLV